MAAKRQSAALSCHSTTPTSVARRVGAEVQVVDDGLILTFRIEAQIDSLLVPDSVQPQIAHGLWQHTCLEAFVQVAGSKPYQEYNLSPSGEWVVYSFSDYRVPAAVGDERLAPAIRVTRGVDWLQLEADVRLGVLLGDAAKSPLRLGLSAVVEERDGTISYWSLVHPSDYADFHHSDAFALELTP